MMRAWITAALLLLFSLADAARLTEIPAVWADRVQAIPPQRLDELEPATASRIRDTRRQLGELLDAPETGAGELAAAYGRLGALYAAHRMYAGAELGFGNARARSNREGGQTGAVLERKGYGSVMSDPVTLSRGRDWPRTAGYPRGVTFLRRLRPPARPYRRR